MTSCTVTTTKGNVAFGGKGAARGEGWAVTWDNEKSFSDGAIAGTAIAGLYYSAANLAAQEATEQVSMKEGTKVQLGAQKLEAFKAGEQTKQFLHATPNPNLPTH